MIRDATPTITGLAEANALVYAKIGSMTNSGIANGSGIFSIDYESVLPDGDYLLDVWNEDDA